MLILENTFDGFADKGVSVGEKTDIIIIGNTFTNNKSAITIKDGSNAYLKSNIYDSNVINIQSYRKKNYFKYPYVYNINEKHVTGKLEASLGSQYLGLEEDVEIDLDTDIVNLLNELKDFKWYELED